MIELEEMSNKKYDRVGRKLIIICQININNYNGLCHAWVEYQPKRLIDEWVYLVRHIYNHNK